MLNNKTFLTVHGIIYTVFAIVLFFGPHLMWPMYGVELNDQYAVFLSQHTSIFLGGIAAISLLLRDVGENPIAKKLFLALFITNLLGLIITLYAGITEIFVGFGWSDPVFFALLTALSYLQFVKNRQ